VRIECHKGDRRYGAADEVVVCEDDLLILKITQCAATPSIEIAGGTGSQGATRKAGFWRWEHKVGRWAGFVRIRVSADGHEPQVVDIAVAPNGKKALRESFQAMIDAVAAMAPHLPWGFALSLLRGRWNDGETSLAVRASLIRALSPEIVALATELAFHPPQAWRSVATLAPFGSRQLKPATQRRVTACPKVGAALSAPDAVGGHQPLAPHSRQRAAISGSSLRDSTTMGTRGAAPWMFRKVRSPLLSGSERSRRTTSKRCDSRSRASATEPAAMTSKGGSSLAART
jgi:hypothetical protein